MWYIDAKNLIDLCIKNGVLQTRDGGIIVYREAGPDSNTAPEGWYLEPIDEVAQALMSDEDGQRTLIDALREKGVTFIQMDKRPFEMAEKLFKPQNSDNGGNTMENTKIEYMYRDGSNYKVYNECIIRGPITDEQIDVIMASLDEGEYFIPSVVGMPEVRFGDVGPWFELDRMGFSKARCEPTLDLTGAELAQRFADAARDNKWQEAEDAWNRYYNPEVGAAAPALTYEKYEGVRKLLRTVIPNNPASDIDALAQAICEVVTGQEVGPFIRPDAE